MCTYVHLALSYRRLSTKEKKTDSGSAEHTLSTEKKHASGLFSLGLLDVSDQRCVQEHLFLFLVEYHLQLICKCILGSCIHMTNIFLDWFLSPDEPVIVVLPSIRT